MSDIAQQLIGAIGALPPTVNPYAFIIDTLFHQMIPKTEPIFIYNIYISYALYSVGLVAGVIALAARIHTGSLWLFRVRKTYDGTLLTINTSLFLTFWSTLFFLINIITLWFLLHSVRDGANPAIFQAFNGLNWLPICSCGWTSAFGVCASSFLSRHRQRSRSRASVAVHKISSQIPAAAASAIISFGFPIGFLAMFAILMPLFGVATMWFMRTYDAFVVLRDIIQPAADAWQPGTPFAFDPAIMPLFEDFAAKGAITLDKTAAGFIGYAVILAIILLVFLPSAVAYLRILSRNLINYMDNLSEQSRVADSRVRELKSTYMFMRVELLLVSLVTITLLATTIYISVNAKLVFSSGRIFTIIYAIALYSFSIFTMPLNCVLAVRALRPLVMSRKDNRMGLAAAIQVQTMVERFVDGEDFEKPVQLQDKGEQPSGRTQPAIVTFDVEENKDDYSPKEYYGQTL